MKSNHIYLSILLLFYAFSGFSRDLEIGNSSTGVFRASSQIVLTNPGGGFSQVEYLSELAALNKMGLQLALLAKGRPVRQELKLFAIKSLEYHKKIDQQLKELGESKQLTIGNEMLDNDKDDIAKLFKLKGILFEKSFLNLTADNHRKLLALYRKAQEKNTDPDFIKLCDAAIPELEAHNAAVRLLRTTIK
ncbi:DUF4142 domain-containing protein [Desertivirga arenae]|uniref:DUF4142 domain-containing protein n=1 Tax=Desertivirga arenae TaxID=2810309 RepID=UPI001A9748F8|nr:DUF4142 domain-containing protein [Pedobacter sp. SYSU D00823]